MDAATDRAHGAPLLGHGQCIPAGPLQSRAVDFLAIANTVLFRAEADDAVSAAWAALSRRDAGSSDSAVPGEAGSPLGSSFCLPHCDLCQVPEDVYGAWAPACDEELCSASLWPGPKRFWGRAMVTAFGLDISVCASLEVAHRLALAATECDVTSAAWAPMVCAHAAVAVSLALCEPAAVDVSLFHCAESSAGPLILSSLADAVSATSTPLAGWSRHRGNMSGSIRSSFGAPVGSTWRLLPT